MPSTTTPQTGVATFDYAAWSMLFPDLAASTNEAQGAEYFEQAGDYLNNTPFSPVQDIRKRTRLLNLLTAHIAQLYLPTSAGGNGAGVVGQSGEHVRILRCRRPIRFFGVVLPDAIWRGLLAGDRISQTDAVRSRAVSPSKDMALMAKSIIKGMDRLQARLSGAARDTQGSWMKRLLDRVIKRADKLPHLNAGFLSNTVYENGTPVAAVAYYNEFGTDRIPARPFMLQAIAKNQDRWPALLAANLKLSGGDINVALDMTAIRIVDQIKHEINTLQDPPLAQSTIDARLRGAKRSGKLKSVNMTTAVKPLIDTGDMLKSVSYEVVDD